MSSDHFMDLELARELAQHELISSARENARGASSNDLLRSTGSNSAKQKKVSLRDKKKKKKEQSEALAKVDEKFDPYRQFYDEEFEGDQSLAPEDAGAALLASIIQKSNLKIVTANGRSKLATEKDLSTYVRKETKEQVYLRVLRSREAINITNRQVPLRASPLLRDRVLDHPRRPKWSYTLTKEEVERTERESFDRWLSAIYDKYNFSQLNHFEHNLEVWRQLWRVLERADTVVIVTDARNPLMHIPPSLYEEVTQERKKKLIIVLNKVDLLPTTVIASWLSYLRKRFKEADFVLFSSRNEVLLEEDKMSVRRKVLSLRVLVACCNRLAYLCLRVVAPSRALRLRKLCPSSKVDVNSTGARAGAQRILEACGVNQEVIAEIMASREHTQEGIVTANAKPKRSRRAKKETKSVSNRTMDTSLKPHRHRPEPCGWCGGGEPVVSCSSCSDGFEALLMCRRCHREVHNSGTKHEVQVLPGQSADAHKDEEQVQPCLKGQSGGQGMHSKRRFIGFIGHPNVGKSSVLNALLGRKAASVSHTPGHTKRLQTLPLHDSLLLCDCPGLIFPFSNLPLHLQELCGLFPFSQVREPFSAVRFLAENTPLERVLELKPRVKVFEEFGEEVEEPWTPASLCEALAEKRGYNTGRMGRLDLHRAGVDMIRETVDGIIPLIFLPPDSEDDDGVRKSGIKKSQGKRASRDLHSDSDKGGGNEDGTGTLGYVRDTEKEDEEIAEESGSSEPIARTTTGKAQSPRNAFSLLESDDEEVESEDG